jgi:hypothetical protein
MGRVLSIGRVAVVSWTGEARGERGRHAVFRIDHVGMRVQPQTSRRDDRRAKRRRTTGTTSRTRLAVAELQVDRGAGVEPPKDVAEDCPGDCPDEPTGEHHSRNEAHRSRNVQAIERGPTRHDDKGDHAGQSASDAAESCLTEGHVSIAFPVTHPRFSRSMLAFALGWWLCRADACHAHSPTSVPGLTPGMVMLGLRRREQTGGWRWSGPCGRVEYVG